MFIYKVTNTVNGKIYIGKWMGKSIQTRWNKHVADARLSRGCPLLGAAIRKYGPEGFVVEEICLALSREALSELEKMCIAQYHSCERKFGYNLTRGGDGAALGELNPMWGKTHTEEVKAQLRTLRLGSTQTADTKRKISEASRGERNGFYGRTHSKKTLAVLAEKCPHYGRVVSASTREKLSRAHTGKVFSAEHKLNLSAAKKGQGLGRKHSLESIERMREIKREWWAAKEEAKG